MQAEIWLPIIFIGLMGLSILIYAVLDGYDLGVGLFMLNASETHRDQMIASIGPFWDANETWLVLAVGLLLVAFPVAHGVVLTSLYTPVAVMLAALILRGVSFEFRVKAHARHKNMWDRLFWLGSLLTSLTQGYMLGRYIVGFDNSLAAQLFSITSAICVTAAYALIGASWLIMKTTDSLQRKAVKWARVGLLLTTLGVVAVSIVNPLASDRIFNKWFDFPTVLMLLPLPLLTMVVIAAMHKQLQRLPREDDAGCWIPFAGSLAIFVLAFTGLAYSFYPYVVPDQLTIWQAASAIDSLMVILWGVIVVLPAILGYTAFSYWIFRGKSTPLQYL